MVVSRTVLVTRPKPGATATAEKLAALGFEPVILPLTRIVRLAPPIPTGAYDAVVATSANALRHAPTDLLGSLADKPIFTVGDATAAAARAAGFARIEHAGGTAADLAELIASRLPRGARILYLAGRIRTESFEEALQDAGYAVEIVETYDAVAIEPDTETLSRLRERPPHAALVYSARAGELLAALAGGDLVRGAFDDTLFLCISRKAAAALERIAAPRIEVSVEPTEEALLGLLSSHG